MHVRFSTAQSASLWPAQLLRPGVRSHEDFHQKRITPAQGKDDLSVNRGGSLLRGRQLEPQMHGKGPCQPVGVMEAVDSEGI